MGELPYRSLTKIQVTCKSLPLVSSLFLRTRPRRRPYGVWARKKGKSELLSRQLSLFFSSSSFFPPKKMKFVMDSIILFFLPPARSPNFPRAEPRIWWVWSRRHGGAYLENSYNQFHLFEISRGIPIFNILKSCSTFSLLLICFVACDVYLEPRAKDSFCIETLSSWITWAQKPKLQSN